ncbi:MAG: glycosyl transferase [Bacteroidales bacterium]|nr:glycosyl transferase [Bacteroidales bacterium]
MIPKIIHYCWFGHGEMSPLAKKCIQSWREKLPDYEIKEWNESNFDLNLYPYTKEAYEKKKYAFVADVVRLYALYSDGGIYMDTDVEVLKSYDPFLHHTAFSGYETDKVTTGIMASEKGGEWVKHNLDYYTDRHFILEDGTMDQTVNVVTIYKYMLELGFRGDNTFQDFPGIITIYPRDYFCPKSYYDGIIRLTDNTVVIHHFEGSWHSKKDKLKYKFLKSLSKGIPGKIKSFVKKLIGK